MGPGGAVEEQAVEHGVGPGLLRDGDQDVAADRVVEVDPRLEGRDRLGGQHGAGRRVGDLHLLAPPLLVPIEEVELQVVLLAVGEVDVHGEAGGGIPGGGDAAGAAGDLEGAGIGGAGGPGPARLAGGRDGGVAGEADGAAAADDVVALRAVGVDPGPLRRRVLLEERGGGRGCRCGRGAEEQAVEHGVGPGLLRDGDQDVAADRVVEVDPRLEGRDRLGGQHGAGRRVGDLHLLAPPLLVPIEEVELQVVLLAVGEVDVHGEAGGGIPGGGDAAGAAGDLEARGDRWCWRPRSSPTGRRA